MRIFSEFCGIITVIIQTIDSVRKFLDAELAKCKTYDGLGRLNLTYLFKFGLVNLPARNSYQANLLSRNLTEGKFKDLQGISRC